MKLRTFPHHLLLLLTSSSAISTPSSYQPLKIKYSQLTSSSSSQQEDEQLRKALNSDGIILISDIPNYVQSRHETLSNLHTCAVQNWNSEDASSSVTEFFLEDGNVRRLTFATHTSPESEGGEAFPFGSLLERSSSCHLFEDGSVELRDVMKDTVHAFSEKLSALLLLDNDDDLSFNASSFEELVRSGEHVEHFHSYQRIHDATAAEEEKNKTLTIDFHTDHGLFIAFTPAQMVSTPQQQQQTSESSSTRLADDFMIQLADSSIVRPEFSEDDIVIMLGDGVERLVNPMLEERLRSVPHSLSMMNAGHDGDIRVWHGRMVLPPDDAPLPQPIIVPDDEDNKKESVIGTSGELRQYLIQSSSSSSLNSIGCSSSSSSSIMMTRSLSGGCEENQFNCWHQCINVSDLIIDQNVSESICASRGLSLKCGHNETGEIWDGGHANSYYQPGCFATSDGGNHTDGHGGNHTDSGNHTDGGNHTDEEKDGGEDGDEDEEKDGSEDGHDHEGHDHEGHDHTSGAAVLGTVVCGFVSVVVFLII